MRLTLRLLGRELLTIEISTDTGSDAPEAEDELEGGPPFGFSGSGGGQVELAADWMTPVDLWKVTQGGG